MNEQVVISIPVSKLEEHKEKVSKREKDLNRIVDEAIQSKELSPDVFLQLKYLHSQIMNETFVHPLCVAYRPFGYIAERLENHIHSLDVPMRLLALKNVLDEVKKLGYVPSVDFDSLKSYVAYRSNFPIYISKGNSCFCITIDEQNIYVIPLGKKPHGKIEYSHIEIPFLAQVISSYK
jgi:hypothetical protein